MSTRFEASIEDALNLPTSIPSTATKPIIQEKKPEDNNDYEYARENLYAIVEKGHDALDTMLEIAKSSEHPRAFEVVNQIMKTMADAQKDLLALKKTQQQITGENNQQPQNVTNALFVGSTAKIQKMIKGRD